MDSGDGIGRQDERWCIQAASFHTYCDSSTMLAVAGGLSAARASGSAFSTWLPLTRVTRYL